VEEEAWEQEWMLEEFLHKGQQLLLDPRTRLVYQAGTDEDSWPRQVGSLTDNGQLRLTQATDTAAKHLTELYRRLEQYMEVRLCCGTVVAEKEALGNAAVMFMHSWIRRWANEVTWAVG
jgi:hypothetical protein